MPQVIEATYLTRGYRLVHFEIPDNIVFPPIGWDLKDQQEQLDWVKENASKFGTEYAKKVDDWYLDSVEKPEVYNQHNP